MIKTLRGIKPSRDTALKKNTHNAEAQVEIIGLTAFYWRERDEDNVSVA